MKDDKNTKRPRLHWQETFLLILSAYRAIFPIVGVLFLAMLLLGVLINYVF